MYKVIILHTDVWRKECLTLKQGIFLMAILPLALTGKSCTAEVKFIISKASVVVVYRSQMMR